MMTGFKALLIRLQQNLNILREREAKYGGNVPLELINQINDHQAAINLTERASQGKLAEAAWREALKPLLVAIQDRTDEASHVTFGDVQIIINTTIQQGRSAPDAGLLREAYLNRLLERCSHLSLSGIDPKAASAQSEARLDLSAVYTALLTFGLEQPESETFEVFKTSKVLPGPNREVRQLSALAQLDRHPRLVLLGDPGSGKSTFVDFVTMCLAGELLGHPQAHLALLTAPLPDDKGQEEPEPQPWRHGLLLPMPVILRDFAARGLPPPGQPATAEHLWRFIAAELKTATLEAFAEPLADELHQKGGLLLLDGLDEVPEAEQRRVQIKQAVEDFARSFKKCRILVTSRTYAYQKQAWRLPDFAEAVLAPFSAGQIRRFVERWYRHMAELRGLHPDDAQGRAEQLKQAIFGSERLKELAQRPLLLTLMASLHAWRGGTLPEKREELYADTVDLLLDWWESPKTVKNVQGQAVVLQPSLAEWLAVDRERVRALLNELAYEAHRSQPDLIGTADIAEGMLVSGLLRLSQNPDLKPARLVEYLSQRAGLLLPRGVGVYTFPHRTFQEYLAACHLTDADYPDRVAELARTEPNRWREVALLAGAKAGRGSAFAVWALIEALCYREPPRETSKVSKTFEVFAAADAWGALLAGQLLVETVPMMAQVSERHRAKVERIKRWLVAILERGELPAVERAAGGNILAHLGDPRPGTGLRPDGLPDISWCEIPAGSFLMGSDPTRDQYKRDDEQSQHMFHLPAFRISRYPITNAQFAAFVADGGYTEKWWQCWTKAGWLEKGNRLEPYRFGGVYDLPNHPVVGVTWYEAVAFCCWLTFRLQASAELTLSQEISLPTERQWEKTARALDGRIYPWGNEPDPNRANCDDTQIGMTSAVGCFPTGASPYGAEDMAGNVWEWCRTWYRDPENEDLESRDNVLRVMRGGAFGNNERYGRCSARSTNFPYNGMRDDGFRVVEVASPF